jgi:hypothetical protein
MITNQQVNAIFQLYPQIVRFVANTAYDADGNEVQYDVQLADQKISKDNCKNTAKSLLAQSDWAVLPDVALINKSDFEAYRAELRELVLNPVVNPTFPTEPTPVWS